MRPKMPHISLLSVTHSLFWSELISDGLLRAAKCIKFICISSTILKMASRKLGLFNLLCLQCGMIVGWLRGEGEVEDLGGV